MNNLLYWPVGKTQFVADSNEAIHYVVGRVGSVWARCEVPIGCLDDPDIIWGRLGGCLASAVFHSSNKNGWWWLPSGHLSLRLVQGWIPNELVGRPGPIPAETWIWPNSSLTRMDDYMQRSFIMGITRQIGSGSRAERHHFWPSGAILSDKCQNQRTYSTV
jgi:hypothetical protein